MRADLSDHYLPAKPNVQLGAEDFFVTNKGRKVIVKPMQIRKNSKSQRKKSITVLSDLPSLQVGALSRHRRARKKSRPSIHTIEEAGKISKINPKLLDNIYGTLDTVAVMKHFPTLSTSYVKSQWANFKRYDSDDNGELDLSEIMKAITGLMPSHVKPAHIEAAMREVDIDGSGTMDFYEYLQVALLLEQKKGKSELFHTPEVTKYNKQISKTCIVQ
ncbi:hypothetical protein EB796_019124 [Bugula neritina]|nr:hypothetical protein EB796_019124 [Bugula neritina]